jgi:hypothetical protein
VSGPVNDQIGVVRYIAESEWHSQALLLQVMTELREELAAAMLTALKAGEPGPLDVVIQIVITPPKDWPVSAQQHWGAPSVRAGAIGLKIDLTDGRE